MYPSHLRFVLAILFGLGQQANAAVIKNPGFESGWEGWRIFGSASADTAISEVARDGLKSAKITGRSGRFEQCVVVHPGRDYELTVFVRGKGKIGAIVGKRTLESEAPGHGKDWAPVRLTFNSMAEREVRIFASFVSGDVRFDSFGLALSGAHASQKARWYQAREMSGREDKGLQSGDCGRWVRPSETVDRSHAKRGLSPYGLRIGVPPSENFDLTDWKLTLPVDRDQDGRADEVLEEDLMNGWSDPAYFYTDPVTGGLVFRTPQRASATTATSDYPRTELREMLRAGDLSIATRSWNGMPNKNNWVLPSAPEAAKAKAGGVGGTLQATLAVNQVTRVGDPAKIGRVIIGQIHAKNNEVLRLYYRKLPTNRFGSIYYAHERGDLDEVYVDIIGDRGDFIPNPKDGIALDEVFSYEVRLESDVSGGERRTELFVDVIRDNGTRSAAKPLDLTESVYADENEFMYFKAGAYSQNDGFSHHDHDGDQITFLKLENSHGR